VPIQLDLYCTLFTLPPSSLPLSSLPTPLKALARGFLVLFHIGIWSPSTIYCHLNLHSPSPSHKYTHIHTHRVPILQSCFSLLIFKLMFKSVSQYMPTVVLLCFGLFNPFHCSPLPLYLLPPIFQQFSVHIFISSTFTHYVIWYYWCSIILFGKWKFKIPFVIKSKT
jgi:hypothetical protein